MNAGEYVADSGQHGYGPGPVVDPPPAAARDSDMADKRLTRGSFWFAWPPLLRCANQSFLQPLAGPHAREAGIGLRLARTLGAEETQNWDRR